MNHIIKSKYWLYDPVYWIDDDYTVKKLTIKGVFAYSKEGDAFPDVLYSMKEDPEGAVYCESELFASFDEAVKRAYDEKVEILQRRIDRECVIEDERGNLHIYKNFEDWLKASNKPGKRAKKAKL